MKFNFMALEKISCIARYEGVPIYYLIYSSKNNLIHMYRKQRQIMMKRKITRKYIFKLIIDNNSSLSTHTCSFYKRIVFLFGYLITR